MIGISQEPQKRLLHPLGWPYISQCVGTESGRRGYTAAEATTAATIISKGIHLRIWSPRAKPLYEIFDDVLKHRGVQLVNHVLSVSLGENELGVLEHAQVTRDRRPAGAELVSDLT